MNEIEIKLKVDSFDGIKEKLSDLGFEMKVSDTEENLFFDDPEGSLVGRRITVRIKKGNGWSSFAVKTKKQDGDYKVADEYQTGISDPDGMIGALISLGLEKKFEYSKDREHWVKGASSVEVDHVPEINGHFIEIEAENGEAIEELVTALGLQDAERDKRSYPDIIKESKR
jgi:predicted adenylyl cyclase CyaB